jgi:sugar phosphate isomerase/epimerase
MIPELGIVADEISRNFREAVRIGTQCGLRRYEIRFLQSGRAPLCDEAELREIESICDGEGLTLTALSPGLFKWADTPEKVRREMDELWPRAIALAQRWQLDTLVIFGCCKHGATETNADTLSSDHPPRWVIDALAEAAERAAQANFKLLIEAEPVCWADTGKATAALIAATGAQNLLINYDPCNSAWQLRRDPLDEFALVAPYIANVHIKDQLDAPVGSGMPTWVVPGEGLLDWVGHFTVLQRLGFRGNYSLEPHINGELATIQQCKAAVERLWEMAEEQSAKT